MALWRLAASGDAVKNVGVRSRLRYTPSGLYAAWPMLTWVLEFGKSDQERHFLYLSLIRQHFYRSMLPRKLLC
jgi:hypothetical protein